MRFFQDRERESPGSPRLVTSVMTHLEAAMTIEITKARERVRRLLDLDYSLTPNERKVLELLLLKGYPLSAKEIGSQTNTNSRSLYPALEKLEKRGLIVRVPSGGVKTYRVVHPVALLMELAKPASSVIGITEELRGELTEIYESAQAGVQEDESDYAAATFSPSASISSVLVHLKEAQEEIWILGPEVGWMVHTGMMRSEILAKAKPPASVKVRVMVNDPAADEEKRKAIDQLRVPGVEVKYSSSFASPMMIIDKEYLFLQTKRAAGATDAPLAYVRIHASELCRDLRRICEQEWSKPQKGG